MGQAETAVLEFLKQLQFPGIRHGEGNPSVCAFLTRNGYHFTPDLVAGPDDLERAPIEGLFFVDVIEPTPDLLFKSSASHNLSIDVSRTFKKILDDAAISQEQPSINALPTEHHQLYLGVLNKKLDKYSHQRRFTRAGKPVVSANLGIAHHFNLGNVSGKNVENVRGLITLLDYVRFYKSLASSNSTDLSVAVNRLLEELANPEQKCPFVMIAFRKWEDVPHLFLVLHVRATKSDAAADSAIILLNTALLDANGFTHPVHQWFGQIIQRNPPEDVTKSAHEDQVVTIGFNRDDNHFR